MKLLLTAINAKYIHSNLAVYSLKASAGEYVDNVEIAEFTINNQADYILKEIYKRKPDVLLFSCYIWNLSMIEEVMREFHKICPTVPIWLGGPEVSFEVEAFYNFDTIKSFGIADYYSRGLKKWQNKYKDMALEMNMFGIKTGIITSIFSTI